MEDKQSKQPKYSAQGFAMIEVMIAVLVLVLGIISMLTLLNSTLQNTDSAAFRNNAALLAADVINRIRSNNAASITSYNLSYGSSPPSTGDQVATDLSQWRSAVTSALPSGNSAINCDSTTRVCVINIRWDDSRAADGSNAKEITLTSLVSGS